MLLKKIITVLILLIIIFSPTFSFADDYIEEDISYLDNLEIEASSNLNDFPSINARHAVVLDRNSNTILYGKSENEKCKMASTTKILTSIVVIENCDDLNEIVTVSKKAARNRWLKVRIICK